MISIIINPVSGGASLDAARARARIATEFLASRGVAGEVFLTERRGHASELTAAALARGDRLVVAWGGDGTMNEVASVLAGTSTVLGLVRSGSGNGLARELGVERDPRPALAAAIEGHPRRIDAGRIGGRWFFSVAGIGFDAHVAAAFDRNGLSTRGFSTYVRLTARELLRYRPGRYRIDGADREVFLIALANSAQFGNGIRIAPGARVDDGVLDLVVFEERSRLATLVNMPRLLTGTVGRARGVTTRQVTTAVVESDTPMLFHVDGEPVVGGTRLEVRVEPGALLVAAP